MQVLFDTNIVSYLLAGDPQFKFPLLALTSELSQKNATIAVSVVTVQELMVHAHRKGAEDEHREFLKAFTVLEFTSECAHMAAKLVNLAGFPAKGGSKKQHKETVNLWQRDAAIAATAEVHRMDMLVTANGKDFVGFQNHVNFVVRVISQA